MTSICEGSEQTIKKEEEMEALKKLNEASQNLVKAIEEYMLRSEELHHYPDFLFCQRVIVMDIDMWAKAAQAKEMQHQTAKAIVTFEETYGMNSGQRYMYYRNNSEEIEKKIKARN